MLARSDAGLRSLDRADESATATGALRKSCIGTVEIVIGGSTELISLCLRTPSDARTPRSRPTNDPKSKSLFPILIRSLLRRDYLAQSHA